MKRTIPNAVAAFIAIFALALVAFAAHAQNLAITVVPSTAVSTTVTTADFTNVQWRGAHLVVNTTALSGGTLTPKVQGKDPVSGAYYDVLTGAAIAGPGTVVLRVYPSLPTATTNTASDLLPQTWRLQMVGASSPVGTLTVGGFLFP